VWADRIGFPDLPAATKVMGRVDHDTEDPGTELSSRIVPVDVPPRREKAILCGVVGVFGMVKDSPRHPSCCRPIAPDQLTERLTVALLGGHGQGGVGYLRTTQRSTPMLNSGPRASWLLN
jgi:hypothetical protein